jgi:hypothetical protein
MRWWCTRPTHLFFYCVSYLKQQSADIHVAPVGQLSWFQANHVVALIPYYCLRSGEAANIVFLFDLTRVSLFVWPDQGITFCLTWPGYHFLFDLTRVSPFVWPDQGITFCFTWPGYHFLFDLTRVSLFVWPDQGITFQQFRRIRSKIILV